MQLKASAPHKTDRREARSDQKSSSRGSTPAQAGELEPIPPGALEIARLARTQANGAHADARGEPRTTARLRVGLHRDLLRIHDDAAYYRLKVILMRTLRKRLQVPMVEVDDAEGPSGADGALDISLEPRDPKTLARASTLAERIVRTGRWRRQDV